MKNLITLIAIFIGIQMASQPAGWIYNMPITVTNPNSINAVDYQLKMTVNTQALISAGQMLSNGNDIRFAGACTSSSFFNYWIEGGINTTTTVIWVKIPFMSASSNTVIFMFYGNSVASAASAVVGTFRGPNSATDSVTGGTSGGSASTQRGFRFQPTQDLLVTHFGKNEPTGTTRYVTLFNYSTQAIISQTQVAGATTNYTYGPTSSPIWLNAATQYVVQLFQGNGDGYYYGTSSQIGQHLTYLDMRYCNSCTQNTFPTSVLSNYHYGYPDFWYFITNTLAITPTYTLNTSSISISGANFICSGAAVTLTTNASGTFSWNTGASTSTITVSPTVTTTYSVAQTNSLGCSSNALITITVNAGPPTLTITSTNATICPSQTVALTATGALSYTWTGGVSNSASFTPASTSGYTVTGANGCGSSQATTTISVIPLPVTSIVSPTVICAANPATLTSGGAVNYTWMPGNLTGSNVVVSPTTSISYTVVGTTSVCNGISMINLQVNPNPTITATASSTLACEGSSVTLTGSGGNNYTWTPGGTGVSIVASPTTSTLYSVTGDNSFGCTSSAAQAVVVVAAPAVTAANNKPTICLGGSATLTAGGAHTYVWNTGPTTQVIVVNPTSNTIYSVIGTNTNTGCSKTNTVSVNVFAPSITTSPNATICPGGSATFTASGASTYTWDTGWQSPILSVSPLTNTSQVVTATTNSFGLSCISAATVSVILYALPPVTAVASKTSICRNEVVTFTAGGATSYTWSNSGTAPTFTLKGTSNITYSFSVTGTDNNGCINTATTSVKVNPCTAIQEMEQENKLVQVFPNPANGEFMISSAVNIDLLIVDELGRTVRELSITKDNSHKILVSGLPEGIYFIKRRSDNLLLEKLVMNR